VTPLLARGLGDAGDLLGLRVVLAHGLGDAGDLPVALPVVLFLAAGAVLLAAALADRAAPPTGAVPAGSPSSQARPPRPVRHSTPRPLPRLTAFADSRFTRAAVRSLALGGLLVVVVAGMLGPSSASVNPVPRTVFVLFWGLLVPVSLLCGPLWRVANPFRTLAAGLARVAGDPGNESARPLPAGVGVWPAAAQLAVFVWAGHNLALSAGAVLLLVLGLTAVQLLAANRYGPAWFRHGDPFEVTAELTARLSPLGRGDDGLLVLRSPRSSVRDLQAGTAGLAVVLTLLVAGRLSDFLLDTPPWHVWRAPLGTGGQVVVDTATLLVLTGLVGLAVTGLARRSRPLLAALVPVTAAYAIAHDAGVLLVEGQFAIIQLGDPLARGWDLLGLSGRFVPLEPVPAMAAALFVVLTLLLGHVAAVVVGRDQARLRYQPRVALAVQLPLRAFLVASVVISIGLRMTVG
jgi:hypothetical protein